MRREPPRGDAPLSGFLDIRWPDVPADATLLVPVGSTEQHGPHLPLDTDTRIAVAVAHGTPGVLVGPPITYGASGEHETFPGTVSLGQAALRGLVMELGRSACRWASRVVLVNGHGGNVEPLMEAVTQLRYEGRDVAWFGCAVPGGDGHAGRAETSLLLALAPAVVRMDIAVAGNTAPLAELLPAMRAGSVRAVSENGVLGDPAGASAAEGTRLLAGLVADLTAALRTWQPDGTGRLPNVHKHP